MVYAITMLKLIALDFMTLVHVLNIRTLNIS